MKFWYDLNLSPYTLHLIHGLVVFVLNQSQLLWHSLSRFVAFWLDTELLIWCNKIQMQFLLSTHMIDSEHIHFILISLSACWHRLVCIFLFHFTFSVFFFKLFLILLKTTCLFSNYSLGNNKISLLGHFNPIYWDDSFQLITVSR